MNHIKESTKIFLFALSKIALPMYVSRIKLVHFWGQYKFRLVENSFSRFFFVNTYRKESILHFSMYVNAAGLKVKCILAIPRWHWLLPSPTLLVVADLWILEQGHLYIWTKDSKLKIFLTFRVKNTSWSPKPV